MNKVSDLTRDTRPSLESILIDSVHSVVEVDRNKSSENGELVKHENDTFYYRVIYLFMQRVVEYYTLEEIQNWSKVELLNEVVLPKIKDYRSNN